jgi:hypothetical protein
MPDFDKLKDRALTRMMICFNDKNTKYFYSYDTSANVKKANIYPGIKKLETMLMGKFANTWQTAIIYENKENGQELARYKDGLKIS